MFGIFALIFGMYLSIKLPIQLVKHKQIMLENGITSTKFAFLQLSCLLYIVSLAGFALPFSWLDLMRPIPTGFLILMPGILIGKKISYSMSRTGINKAVNAGRAANNVMWLGIGVGIFITANIVFGLLYENIGNSLP